MRAIYGRGAWLSVLAGAGLLVACGGDSSSSDARRNVELAPTGSASSKGTDAPASTGGIRRLLGLGPRTGSVGAGTSIAARTSERVCTNTHKAGSTFAATVREPVQGSNGAVIPAGAQLTMRVTESARSENSKDNVRLAFAVTSLRIGQDTYTVDGKVSREGPLELVRAQSTTQQAEKIGAGAAIGAIAGQLLGKNTRSTVTGAVVGAAAGTAVAVGTADYDGCMNAGAGLAVTLSTPLTVKIAPKTKAAAGT